jgi:hypothetical protein
MLEKERGAAGCGRLLRIGIVKHDEGTLAAEFERQALQIPRGCTHDRLPRRNRGRRRDHRDSGMLGQCGGDLRTGAGKVVEDTG